MIKPLITIKVTNIIALVNSIRALAHWSISGFALYFGTLPPSETYDWVWSFLELLPVHSGYFDNHLRQFSYQSKISTAFKGSMRSAITQRQRQLTIERYKRLFYKKILLLETEQNDIPGEI